MTLPGRPLASVRRYMPLTKPSMTVRRDTTSVNASAVDRVVFQRTARLRRLYASGTLPSTSRVRGRAAAPAPGSNSDQETGKGEATARTPQTARANTSATLTAPADHAG